MIFSDKCNFKQIVSHPMDSGNCRSYWKCNLQKSVGDCCPTGQRYKKYQGCEKDATCTDPCPGDSFHQGPCDSRPIFGDRSVFQQFVEGVNWHNMTCPSNTQYSALACGCVYHKGYDGGKIFIQKAPKNLILHVCIFSLERKKIFAKMAYTRYYIYLIHSNKLNTFSFNLKSVSFIHSM